MWAFFTMVSPQKEKRVSHPDVCGADAGRLDRSKSRALVEQRVRFFELFQSKPRKELVEFLGRTCLFQQNRRKLS